MGRISFEEIGSPLQNRITIVVSSTKNFTGENCYTVSSLQEHEHLCRFSAYQIKIWDLRYSV